MIFEVKNIGKIRHADVKLDGITVIAGENLSLIHISEPTRH